MIGMTSLVSLHMYFHIPYVYASSQVSTIMEISDHHALAFHDKLLFHLPG
jgi:hypothetical protein